MNGCKTALSTHCWWLSVQRWGSQSLCLLPQFPSVGWVLLGVSVDVAEEQRGFQTPEMHHGRHARLFFSVCWGKPRVLCIPANTRPLSSTQPQVVPNPREMAKVPSRKPSLIQNFKLHLSSFVCMCGPTCAKVHMWRSRDNLQESTSLTPSSGSCEAVLRCPAHLPTEPFR